VRKAFLQQALKMAGTEADFYSGCRKILQRRRLRFKLKDDFAIKDCGFTKTKLTLLRKLYLHDESRDMAVKLWHRRLEQKKYGSVGFTCYNHLLKADPSKKSKRASVMGPCIQAVTLTLNERGSVNIDAFYRTTELFKKFPADLVFMRDELLEPFELENPTVTCHFANITCHPMYFVTLVPLMDRPIQAFEDLRHDEHFYNWCVKWTARYVCEENSRGIQKFAQALRVQKDALERIEPKQLKKLQAYLRKNHPGYRNDYEGDDDE